MGKKTVGAAAVLAVTAAIVGAVKMARKILKSGSTDGTVSRPQLDPARLIGSSTHFPLPSKDVLTAA